MSLDVYLTLPGTQHAPTGDGIFVREDGRTMDLTRAEWDARFPGREPVVVLPSDDDDDDDDEVFHANITHNLNSMAKEAGIYEALWRPKEIGVTHAAQLIPLLSEGLTLLTSDPERFRRFNPENGWGTYEGLLVFVADYLDACKAYPTAEVYASR